MKHIVLLGAGGKMGMRLTSNLLQTDYAVRPVEISERGREALAARGVTALPLGEALPGAEAVILAVPDNRIGQVAHQQHSSPHSGPVSR